MLGSNPKILDSSNGGCISLNFRCLFFPDPEGKHLSAEVDPPASSSGPKQALHVAQPSFLCSLQKKLQVWLVDSAFHISSLQKPVLVQVMAYLTICFTVNLSQS